MAVLLAELRNCPGECQAIVYAQMSIENSCFCILLEQLWLQLALVQVACAHTSIRALWQKLICYTCIVTCPGP